MLYLIKFTSKYKHLMIYIHICGNLNSVLSPPCCQLICAILFLLLNNFIINLNFLSCSCVCVCCFLPFSFHLILEVVRSQLHTRLIHLDTTDCSVLPKSLCLPKNPARTTSKPFVTLSINKCSSQLEARCHRRNNLFFYNVWKLK